MPHGCAVTRSLRPRGFRLFIRAGIFNVTTHYH